MSAASECIVVGVLGQWASGKTTAAKTLIEHLGGRDQVHFITDRALLARMALESLYSQGEDQVESTLLENGRTRLQRGQIIFYLHPGQDLDTADLDQVPFDVPDALTQEWLVQVRQTLGKEIRLWCDQGVHVVIEAGYGLHPAHHTLPDLFQALDQAQVEPQLVKWIVVEATFERRLARNSKRADRTPEEIFARLAADGGGLGPDQLAELASRGTVLKRVSNDHDDKDRFIADLLAAFEELFGHGAQEG